MTAIPNEIFIPFNFGGLRDEYSAWDTARTAVISVPYDLTTSYLPGTRKGPYAIIEASTHMELFDEELKTDISSIGIHTLQQLEPITSSPEKMVERVTMVINHVLDAHKFPVMLGGEHSITVGAVQAFKKHYTGFGVVQFDAHADMRDTFEGSPFNHACVCRRISENCPLTQIGIRSLSEEEYSFLNTSNIHTYFAKDIVGRQDWIEACIDNLPPDIYLTIDLDVFDPSIMPSVGTPEPGGLGWYEMLHILKSICMKKRVLGFDVVELCPNPINPGPDFLAAKLCYKLLGYIYYNAY